MADFGEICPLFNTGVFNELMFPNIKMTHITACGNALVGTLTASSLGNFTFSRTVIVTAAWVRKIASSNTVENAKLVHHTSRLAAGTVFGTLTITVTKEGFQLGYGYVPMTVTEKTFTSAAVLGFTYGTGSAASAGTFDLLIRYKEK